MMHLRSIALALAVLPLLVMPARAQDGPATHQNSRTDLFIGFGGQSRLGNGDAGWRSAVPLSVDVNVTDRVALVVMPALGVGVSTTSGSWVDYAFQAGPRFRFGGQQRVTPFVQILAGVQHGTVAPPNGVVAASPPDRGTAFLMSFGGGVDATLNSRFAWRAIQVEERSQFGDLGGGHQLAVSSGLVIRFGTRK
jgi:hypothetical protein